MKQPQRKKEMRIIVDEGADGVQAKVLANFHDQRLQHLIIKGVYERLCAEAGKIITVGTHPGAFKERLDEGVS